MDISRLKEALLNINQDMVVKNIKASSLTIFGIQRLFARTSELDHSLSSVPLEEDAAIITGQVEIEFMTGRKEIVTIFKTVSELLDIPVSLFSAPPCLRGEDSPLT
jgi:hypothetical protein